jgi:hypothetical protein
MDDFSRLWLSCSGPLDVLLTKLLNYLTFQSCDLMKKVWRYQKGNQKP